MRVMWKGQRKGGCRRGDKGVEEGREGSVRRKGEREREEGGRVRTERCDKKV